jgi:hypothetical protein
LKWDGQDLLVMQRRQVKQGGRQQCRFGDSLYYCLSVCEVDVGWTLR